MSSSSNPGHHQSLAAPGPCSSELAASQAHPPAALRRNRNFILLWCAYTTSALGDHLSEMALLDMQDATQRDDATRISAIMMFALMLPFFLFGPVAGWLADRLPRKWIMVTADLARSALMLSLAAMLAVLAGVFSGTSWELVPGGNGRPPILDPWVYAFPLFVTGLFAATFSPARAAMLPTLIRTDQIVRGNGLMNAMGPIATIASFLMGGYLVARFGAKVNFQVDALTFLASACLILCIRPPQRPPATTGPARRNDRMIDGFNYCRTHRRVVELILYAVLFWSAAGVVRSVVPALVGHVFGGGIQEIGYYQAALGIGMLVGAFILAGFGDALRSEIAISWSLVGAGLGACWLAAVAAYRLDHFSGYASLFFTGMFGSGILVSVNAALQRIVPDFFRGRVFGVMDVATIAGLLLSTGALAIPQWTNIDRYVPGILLAVGLGILTGGFVALGTRLRRGRFGVVLTFWRNLAEFHNRLIARVRRDGICTIPPAGPVILACNHTCSIDPLLLVSTSPNRYPSFMIAREYARIPIVSRLVRMIQCIPVNRTGVDTASIKAALRHLAEGRMLGIFPQGRIRRPDEAGDVQEGVGLLALRSGATVIPAHISGTHYSDGVILPFFRPHRAVVRYGPPVDLSPWQGREKDRAAYREVARHIMNQINALASAKA